MLEVHIRQPMALKLGAEELVGDITVNTSNHTHLAFSYRTRWYSYDRTSPLGPTVLARLCVMLPLPVPASMTVPPTRTPRRMVMYAMSGVYRICVR